MKPKKKTNHLPPLSKMYPGAELPFYDQRRPRAW
jgi:hypothetical protein